MTKVTIIVPCYNEEDNVKPMAGMLSMVMSKLSQYDYEIVFRDNGSQDLTAKRLKEVAKDNKHIKAIINSRNYGVFPEKNTFKGHVSGDVIISIACDFQEPPELIPEFLSWYEKGCEIVAGQKTSSKEGKIKYGLRQIYYKIIDLFSDCPRIPNMSGIFLASRRVMETYWSGYKYQTMDHFIADMGLDVKLIQYEQQKRKSGKSSYNIWRYLSFSITSLVQTSTVPLRIATVAGLILAIFSFIVGIVYLVMKIIWWDMFSAGMTPVLIGLFFLGSIQLLFIGLVGEYVGQILKISLPDNPPAIRELINYESTNEEDFVMIGQDHI